MKKEGLLRSFYVFVLVLTALYGKLVPAQSSLAEDVEKLSYYTENYPPANFYDNYVLKGISVDTLKLIWQKLDTTPKEISVQPWARAYRNVLLRDNTVLFTMSRTPQREKDFKWVGPVFHSNHVLVAKSSRKLQFDSIEQVFQHRVATIRGDISEISLRQQGFPEVRMGKVSDLKQAFLMLRNDRVDMMMISIHGFQHVLSQLNESRNKYEIVWRVNKIGNYYAFNKNTSDAVIDVFQQAFDSLEQERLAIKKKYELPAEEY